MSDIVIGDTVIFLEGAGGTNVEMATSQGEPFFVTLDENTNPAELVVGYPFSFEQREFSRSLAEGECWPVPGLQGVVIHHEKAS